MDFDACAWAKAAGSLNLSMLQCGSEGLDKALVDAFLYRLYSTYLAVLPCGIGDMVIAHKMFI